MTIWPIVNAVAFVLTLFVVINTADRFLRWWTLKPPRG